MGKLLHIFGKELTEHINDTETCDRYLELRIARFSEEFLNSETTYEDTMELLECIQEYLEGLDDDSDYFLHSIHALQHAIWWLDLYIKGE